jgi:hypothetical protein
MPLFALSPDASDFFTLWGFVVGVVSLVVGAVAFGFAIVQIREARDAARASRTAAEAARDAAQQTLAESEASYVRFAVALANRLLSEFQAALREKVWAVARMRATDLAELLASLPAGAVGESAVAACTTELRATATDCARLEAKSNPRVPKDTTTRWAEVVRLTYAILDRLHKPFRKVQHGGTADGDPATRTPTDDDRTRRENQSATGKLDAPPDGT